MSRFFKGGSSSDDSEDESDKRTDVSSGRSESEDSSSSSSGSSTSSSSSSGSDSDSDSSSSDADFSESESESSSDASDSEDSEAEGKKKLTGAARFMRGAASSDSGSDSDEDGKRVVRSAAEKRADEIMAAADALADARAENDWVSVQAEFDKMTRLYEKAKHLIARNGPPAFYVIALAELEDFVSDAAEDKDIRKKLNSLQARAFNAMKQKTRKYTKDYERALVAYRKDPDNFGSAAAAGADAGDDGTTTGDGKKKVGFAAAEGEEDKKGDEPKEKEKEPLTPENLLKRLDEALEERGKKRTDKAEHVNLLLTFLEVADNDYKRLKVLTALVPARFDQTLATIACMPTDSWKMAQAEMNQILDILDKNPHVTIREDIPDDLVLEEPEVLEKRFTENEELRISGSMYSLLDRLEEEFHKSLLQADPHTSEYIDRLRDEPIMYKSIVRFQAYFERIKHEDSFAHTAMKRVENLYYKPDNVIKIVEEQALKATGVTVSAADIESPVPQLCVRLYKVKNDRIRMRALLCHVYHLAFRNKFNEARDILLMSHIQDNIKNTDLPTQMLFNRTIVQLGFCAFRLGKIQETHSCLHEISSTNRVRELLGQGLPTPKFWEKPETERTEKVRQLPFHMHVNLELLECIYYTCSMLQEIPNMALNAYDWRKKTISKPFRRMLDYHERQTFIGPPDNTRDHIMMASKELAEGNWRACRDLICAIKAWNLMPECEEIKKMLGEKIQAEGVRVYFFTFGRHYDSIGLDQLAQMFELDTKKLYSMIARMIIDGDVRASMDQNSKCVVFHGQEERSETTRLEYLAKLYSEKVFSLVDGNERLLQERTGVIASEQYHRKGFKKMRG